MFAALPMYARPSNRAAHDALWGSIRDGLRARGIAAPDALDHEAHHMAGWGRDDLVLSHICNLPWRTRHRDNTRIVGASDYGLPDTEPGYYFSYYVVRQDDPAQEIADLDGRSMALNDGLSQSGWGAAHAQAASRGVMLYPAVETGAHGASLQAVATGAADFATIDAQVWRIETSAGNPLLDGLKIIGRTPASPGMSFITGPGMDVDAVHDAVAHAISALSDMHRATLGLCGIVRLPAEAYDLPLAEAPRFAAVAP